MRTPDNKFKESSISVTIIISVSVLLISICLNISISGQNSGPIVIHAFQNRLSILNTSQLVDNINFIPLETTENNLIGTISKLIKTDDKYYILDNKKAKKIFVFDTRGKFLYCIGTNGKGPGEYSNLTDFAVDVKRNFIYLVDNRIKLIKMGLNGDFILEKKVPDDCKNYSDIIAYNGLIYASPGQQSGNEKKYNLVQFDEELNPINRFLPYENSFPGTFPFNNRLYTFNNSIYFVSAFENIIYCKSADKFTERFIFDVDGKGLILKDLTVGKFIENKTGVYLFDSCVEGDDLIFVPIFYSGKPRFGFLQKKSNRFFIVDKINGDPVYLSPFISYHNGMFISEISSNLFKKYFPHSIINPELTDNPIIIEYQISYKGQ
jgi:hypothetical protein